MIPRLMYLSREDNTAKLEMGKRRMAMRTGGEERVDGVGLERENEWTKLNIWI